MKQHWLLSIGCIVALTTSALCACSEETFSGIAQQKDFDEGEVDTCYLALSVNDFSVNGSSASRAAEDWTKSEEEEKQADDNEKRIDNLWVFQYGSDGSNLINPRYYEIKDQSQLDKLPVILKPATESTIYVVTNTNSDSWAKDGKSGFSTLEELKKQSLPNVFPKSNDQYYNGDADEKTVLIPMEGSVKQTVTKTTTVEIPVTRMYAKLMIKLKLTSDVDKTKYDFGKSNLLVENIPGVLQVQSRYTNGSTAAAEYPTSATSWISRTFSTFNENYVYTIYVPENIQGVSSNTETQIDKSSLITSGQTPLKLTTSILNNEGITSTADVYPGGNTYNDFNIKRNCVYRIVFTASPKGEVLVPSANCFVVAPGGTLAFYPYIRNEQGGGYNFRDYLDNTVDSKKIKGVKIIWQTKDCIGDNSNKELVYFEDNGLKTKIYVKAGSTAGNALIGAYNNEDCTGDVLWSWHIWVTDLDPANVSSAIVYKRYYWDATHIDPSTLVDGYGGVMKCDLGALALTNSNEKGNNNGNKAFGMMYQWGRKDPFPPLTKAEGNLKEYSTANTAAHYGNDNFTKVEKTCGTSEDVLFHSVLGSGITGSVDYAVAHPTVFITGTYSNLKQDESYVDNSTKYFNNGDWADKSDDKLWGGKTPILDAKQMTYYTVSGTNRHIFDNYGEYKSIYDPCPKGWRVAPGDLWLRFTYTGENTNNMDLVNYNVSESKNNGMMMYLQDWRGQDGGAKSFFVTPGPRVGNGWAMRQFTCGNYHNATADTNNSVNILHIHDYDSLFKLFETMYKYSRKSVAGPVRCIRCTTDDNSLPDYAK